MEKFLPSGSSISSETETEINKAIDAEINRRSKAMKESNPPLDSLYQEFQDKFPLDPLFKNHIETLLEENARLTQQLETLKVTNSPDPSYIHNLNSRIALA